MGTNLTELDVWNLILDHLVEHPLSSRTEDSAYARWMGRNVANLRDAFLRQYTWNFSIQYNTLTAEAATPAFRWRYQYGVPYDALRVLPPTEGGVRGGTPIPYEVVGEKILCDVSGTLYVRTIQRIEDYTSWDPIAVDLFTLVAAIRATMRFTSKATHRDRLIAEARELAPIAYSIDAMEGTPDPTEQHDVLDVRFV